MKKISKKEQLRVTGGRRVEKEDTDGDGRWDIKRVYDNNDNLIKYKVR